MLSDDILLNIFLHYLDATPRLWPILTHVCRRWQQVVLSSPATLQLRHYCTHGTPVLKILDRWPPLPLVMNYGGSPMLDPPAPEDEVNIIAALKQSDRVKSINLTLTNSLLGKLSTISEPFSNLEELVLLSQDKLQQTLPCAFRWGERVRTLHVTGIVIPSLPQLLASSTDLVDLRLHEINTDGYFTPQAFANVLSGASHLQSLSLHFLSFPRRRTFVALPPPGGHRNVLPALTCFIYRGTSKYLDSFVARIDAPRLGNIDITFFNQPTFDASQLGQFIRRTDMQTTLTKAYIRTSAHAISISIEDSNTSTTPLRLQISCRQLDWQLSSMAQVCDQLSPFLSGVNHWAFNSDDFPSGQDGVDGGQWQQLIRSFGGITALWITGELTTDILCALRPADERGTTNTAVLPALRNIRVRKPLTLDSPFWDTAQSLVTSRGLSHHPVYWELQVLCHICNTGFTPQKLKEHLVAQHAYEIARPNCGEFRLTQAHIHRFQRPLSMGHPEVAQNDEIISQSPSTPILLQRDTPANWHCSLRDNRSTLRQSRQRTRD